MEPGMNQFGKSEGGGRRAVARVDAPLTAVISTLIGSRSAELVDISATGARLRGTELPDLREELSLAVEGVHAFGTIVWSEGDLRGMRFDEPLGLSDEVKLRQKVAQAAGVPLDIRAAFDQWTLGPDR
jgi:hypothetical protein